MADTQQRKKSLNPLNFAIPTWAENLIWILGSILLVFQFRDFVNDMAKYLINSYPKIEPALPWISLFFFLFSTYSFLFCFFKQINTQNKIISEIISILFKIFLTIILFASSYIIAYYIDVTRITSTTKIPLLFFPFCIVILLYLISNLYHNGRLPYL